MKGIIFDLDGVLVNSMPSHSQAWVDAFANIAGIKVERKIIYVMEGMRGEELVEKILAQNDISDRDLVKKIAGEKDMIFKSMEKPQAFEGVKEMVQSLKCAKAVVSGSGRHDVESVLDAAIGKDLFDVIITADDVKKGKPDPLAFNTALGKLHVKTKEAVVVENAPLGVQAANSAGIPCFVVLNNTPLTRQDFAGLISSESVLEKTSSLKGPLEQMCK
ncbi:MAG: HAD family phosphatase [Nitrososphaera sp.]